MIETIGNFLVETRKKKKLTRKALADISGFKERTIASYERGENKPSKEYIDFIESYFDIDISHVGKVEKKFISYYDTFDNSVGYALVKNEFKKVYSDNPLVTLIFDSSEFPDSMFLDGFQDESSDSMSDITLINGLDFQTYKRFFMRNSESIGGYFDSWLKKLKKVNCMIIVKNDLFKKGYPLLEDSCLGAVWSVIVTKEKVIFRAVSKNFDFNFNYISEELDEYKIKIDKINEEEIFTDDYQSYNDEEKKEIRGEFDRLEKEYKMITAFRLEMTREEFEKLTILGTWI